MINVTGFFRDPEAWEALRLAVIRPLVEERSPEEPIRAWVTACASGEEPYSLAMLIAEEAERLHKNLDIKIFATDTAEKSLALARAGIYPGGIEGDRLAGAARASIPIGSNSCVSKWSSRPRIFCAIPRFRVLTLSPAATCSFISSRRHSAGYSPCCISPLRDGGHLFSGQRRRHWDRRTSTSRWSANTGASIAAPVRASIASGISRHFRAGCRHRAQIDRVTQVATISRPHRQIQSSWRCWTVLVQPTAVVDANERNVYFHGDSGPFLLSPAGEITSNFIEMVRLPLRASVRAALRQAIAEKRPTVIERVFSEEAGGTIRVTAEPLPAWRAPGLFRVSFEFLQPVLAGIGASGHRAART